MATATVSGAGVRTVATGKVTHRGVADTRVGTRTGSSQAIQWDVMPSAAAQMMYPISVDGLRFIAQHIMTRRFLHWDLPINDPQITWNLSGPFELTGTLDPPFADVVDWGPDAWSVFIHVEYQGVILGTGIMQPLEFTDETMTIEAVGVSSYPHGIPYLDVFEEFFPDVMTVVRECWRHIQSFPNGNMGVQLPTGFMGVPLFGEAVHDDETGELLGYQKWQLLWTDFPDCGSTIEELAASTPFDFREVHAWNANHSDVLHGIGVGYPRLGAMRGELRFAVGENILEAVPIGEPDDAYASDIVIKGAGEGPTQLFYWLSVAVWDRLRRVVVITDEQIVTQNIAEGVAEQELMARLQSQGISTIVVDAFNHLAPLGSFAEGDDILIEVDQPWFGRLALWHRVTAMTLAPETGLLTCDVARSESFRYGRPAY